MPWKSFPGRPTRNSRTASGFAGCRTSISTTRITCSNPRGTGICFSRSTRWNSSACASADFRSPGHSACGCAGICVPTGRTTTSFTTTSASPTACWTCRAWATRRWRPSTTPSRWTGMRRSRRRRHSSRGSRSAAGMPFWRCKRRSPGAWRGSSRCRSARRGTSAGISALRRTGSASFPTASTRISSTRCPASGGPMISLS